MLSVVLTLVLRLSAGAPPFEQFITWVENTDEMKLSHIIHKEVIKKRPSLQYADMDIISIISHSGNDILVIIDKPVSVLLQVAVSENQNEVSYMTNQSSYYSIQITSAMNVFSKMMENPQEKW